AFESSAAEAANAPAPDLHNPSSSSPGRLLRARMEHRWGKRFPVRAAVRLHCAKWDAAGYLKDASLSGAFIHTRLLVAPWLQVELELLGIRIEAYVVRTAADGLGIEWTEFAPPVIRELLSL